MTALIGIHSLSKSYGTQTLFKDISFSIVQGDRTGLIGPNGSGKSTLFKILTNLESPDSGSISKRQGLRIGYASQVPIFPDLSLEEVLVQSAPRGNEIDLLTRARILLGKAQFTDTTMLASVLSGGWKKRLDIARALMQEPDLLFLDEPTNHLDLEGILWLERFLMKEMISYVVISHDRYFLENITNKVIELNKCFPQGLFISEGNMSAYMEHREAFLEGQQQMERGLASVVREEIEWLRKSPKARTTKSRSRIQNAYKLMAELSTVKKRNKTVRVELEFSGSERETRKLLSAKNLTKSLGGKQLFTGIDLTLSPGTRLGVTGKNGTGKTSLLKILAGMMTQDLGTIKYADDLKLVYFDQHREQINPEIPLKQALSPNSDYVNFRGQSIHVNGWAKKFLFSPDRLTLPVKYLSGGERARILIAKLMLQPADILFLDEPTNDLDIPTLEVIEENLLDFPGALVLITHDRCLMDRVCTQILGLGLSDEPQYFADYNQWEAACNKPKMEDKPKATPAPVPARPASAKKLSYKEEKELETMDKDIMAAEEEIVQIHQRLDNPEIHADPQKSLEYYRMLSEAQHKLEGLFHRWEELERKKRTEGT